MKGYDVLKKIFLRLTVLLCSAVFIFTACKNRDGAAQSTVYKSETVEIASEIMGDFDSFTYSGGKIYFLSEVIPSDEENYSAYYLNSADTDGKNFSSKLLSEDDKYICNPRFGADGTLYYVKVWENGSGHEYALCEVSPEGETTETDITEAVNSCDSEFYPSIIFADENDIYISDRDSIIVLSHDGALKKFIPDAADGGVIWEIVRGSSGRVYIFYFNGYGYALKYIDGQDYALKTADFSVDGYSSSVFGGRGDAELFVSDGTALYSLGADGEKTEILNFVQSGISFGEIDRMFADVDGSFICVGKSMDSGAPVISVLSLQANESDGRKEIVLAGTENSIDAYIENAAVKFNNSSSDSFITIKKYPWDGIDKLNLDITSGKMPDILISDSYVPTENYISKGIFADLYPFIDNDSELERSDLLQNLLSSCETDGKLYRFTDRFKIYTALGKTSVFGEKMGLTLDELQRIAASRPEGTETFPGVSKQDILNYALELSGDEFIDYRSGTCRFDLESFISLMKYADSYIDSIDYDNYFDDSFWERLDTMFADESALLMTAYLSDYTDIYRFEHINFGEPVTAVGFPCENRIGTSFILDSSFSICESSSVKQGSWEFLRTLLLPEYQDKCDCFPVRTDSLEKFAETAMKHDPNRINQAIVIMGQMALSSGISDIGEPIKADIDRVNDIIASADGIMSYNSSVSDIISEEAETFFSKSKTAEETAQLIQSRVKLYLEEQS